MCLFIDPEPPVNQGNEISVCVPVLFDILPHFLLFLLIVVDAGQLPGHSLFLFKLLFPVNSILLCLRITFIYHI